MSIDFANPYLAELREKLSKLPNLPGVYVMKGQNEIVLYIGKAKDLQKRVRSYFGVGDGRHQIAFLMRRVVNIETTICESESHAILLERDLIHQLKPKYNIKLKDDKSFYYVRVDRNAQWPRIELVRRFPNDGAEYFGPYRSSLELRSILEVIRNVFPLRSCSDSIMYNRVRPCLEYQIKRCCGPCCLPVERDIYMSYIDDAIKLLQGDYMQVKHGLESKMEAFSGKLMFEQAAVCRDRLEILEKFSSGDFFRVDSALCRDAIGLYREEQCAVICVLKSESGRIRESFFYNFDNICTTNQEFLASFLEIFYSEYAELPAEIVIPENLYFNQSDFLLNLSQNIIIKSNNDDSSIDKLLSLANFNARQQFKMKFEEAAEYDNLAKKISLLAFLDQVPRRIECLDISNLQGTAIVGAIVTFIDGKPQKSLYKKYKISKQGEQDDFQSIYEVVQRRLSRGISEQDLPDLLIIDGGKGQLSSALRARDELNITLPIISLAKERNQKNDLKKPERLFLETRADPILLAADDKLTHFLAKVRDEVHRFVLQFHRTKRQSLSMSSQLDGIAGLGPARKQRLLRYYGSLSKIASASPEEISKNCKLPLTLAGRIKNVLSSSD